ncbi:MAG: hypothetical protein AAGG99_00485 [Pseudomonadota bacterium]
MRNRTPTYCARDRGAIGASQALEADVVIAFDAKDDARRPDVSVVTLVTDGDHYAAMRRSFELAGFDDATCEFIAIDNRQKPGLTASEGLNLGLEAARGTYVILCHQDVRLTHDGRPEFQSRMRDLALADPHWGLAGNAGGVSPTELAIRISDPHGHNRADGPFPAQVQSLDENFIVVRGGARFGVSRDHTGFHLYGADLCLGAAMAGHTAYVIDFHLTHLSAGVKDEGFDAAERTFVARWNAKLQPRWLRTTCTLMYLDGGLAERALTAMVPGDLYPKLTSARRWLAQRTSRRAVRTRSDTLSVADGA